MIIIIIIIIIIFILDNGSTSMLLSGFLGVQSPDSSVEQLSEDPVPGGHSAPTAGGADGVLPEAALHLAGPPLAACSSHDSNQSQRLDT